MLVVPLIFFSLVSGVAAIGDLRTVRLPGGAKEWEVMEIAYD